MLTLEQIVKREEAAIFGSLLEKKDTYKERALKAEEKLAWIRVCSEEIITLFPQMTLRTIWKMGSAIEALKDAIKQ